MCELEIIGSSSLPPSEETKITRREGEKNGDLLSLPNDVIGSILSLTTPMEACRSSAVSRSFNAAAQLDIIWNSFLPSDIDFMISLAKPNDLHFDPISSSMKHIFLSLCQTPLLFDGGTKSVSLEKRGGKKCIMHGARDISINIHHIPYNIWSWEYHPDSRFGDVAVFVDTYRWNRISGRINCRTLSRRTIYAAYFVFNLKKGEYTGYDVCISLIIGRFPRRVHLDRYLAPERRQQTSHSPWSIIIDTREVESKEQRSRIRWTVYEPTQAIEVEERQDGWFESGEDGGGYEVFDVFITRDNKPPGSDLVVEGIEVRPIIL